MPSVDRDGVRFHYRTAGDEDGFPVFLAHGLGGDVAQPFRLFAPPPGIHLLSFDCRGHGDTRPLGDPEKLRFTPFADNVVAVMDHLAIERAVIGGVSMGVGVALNATLRYPACVRALILVRPAWLDGPMPEPTRRIYATIAELIRRHGGTRGA
jgi:pimeloyl-ACP methyl ester carboxylesterase